MYNMETYFEKEALWWGGESDTYLPLTEDAQPQDDGSLYDEVTNTTYMRVAETDIAEVALFDPRPLDGVWQNLCL